MSSHSLSSIPTDRQMDRFRVVGRFINNDNTNGMKGDIIAQGTCHHVVCQAFPQTDRPGLFVVFYNDKMEEMEET